jgi:hypothetical protein
LLAGDGIGTVTGPQIDCPSDCVGTYAPGTDVMLIAVADPPSSFVEWLGCDFPTGDQCTMDLTTDKSVTASFDDPS